ncbi:unnamed protein product [Sphenostylis stenocarpa]|uniref:Uncharacterized protein n=1 Tax=Sphenostylis stenocarpa TaxID=92480 RepID=A0AA86VKH9_9FABA|nr:unnamed protein product [Sphenostylis stenocarpa]
MLQAGVILGCKKKKSRNKVGPLKVNGLMVRRAQSIGELDFDVGPLKKSLVSTLSQDK